MTFLAPWALAIAGIAAAGMVLLHLVARSRPAAYVLPTTRFIPDRRTLVSRAATRPRDLLLLALRVLLLLSAGAAFARPVRTPARGAIARVLLLDRSSSVANAGDAVARARAIASDGVPTTVIAFDTTARVLTMPAWDSLSAASVAPWEGAGSLSAALVAARRAAGALAERADSVQLVVVSPIDARALDAATLRIRAQWPGAVRIERVALRADSSAPWRLERALSPDDPLGPAVIAQLSAGAGKVTRLSRSAATAADSAFARAGGTVVHWDSTSAVRARAEGLAAGEDVVVASLGRTTVPLDGRVLARWADGTAAAVERRLDAGCVRDVGIAVPAGGDIALHPAFQRIVRTLLAPCGQMAPEQALRADSAAVSLLVGTTRSAAPGAALRSDTNRYSPLATWLLALALLLAITELTVRRRATGEGA